jgi:hypothetical protein
MRPLMRPSAGEKQNADPARSGLNRRLRRSGACVLAEDRGFEPLRAFNPTRFPSERHRPLGESSAQEITGRGSGGEIDSALEGLRTLT